MFGGCGWCSLPKCGVSRFSPPQGLRRCKVLAGLAVTGNFLDRRVITTTGTSSTTNPAHLYHDMRGGQSLPSSTSIYSQLCWNCIHKQRTSATTSSASSTLRTRRHNGRNGGHIRQARSFHGATTVRGSCNESSYLTLMLCTGAPTGSRTCSQASSRQALLFAPYPAATYSATFGQMARGEWKSDERSHASP
jgi:hypothetical protein